MRAIDHYQNPVPHEAAARALCEAMDDNWESATMPGGHAPWYRRLAEVVLESDRAVEKGRMDLDEFLRDHPLLVQIDYEDCEAEDDGDGVISYYRVWWKESRPDWLDGEDD